uniref:hypothetical protein n=1 Tax=Planococcus lenghuensis TaxID=2213202 RepID=UPI0038CDA06C
MGKKELIGSVSSDQRLRQSAFARNGVNMVVLVTVAVKTGQHEPVVRVEFDETA